MEQQLENLRLKTGGHICGRHVFFRELVRRAKEVAVNRKLPKAMHITLMRKHSALFDDLPLCEQTYYHDMVCNVIAERKQRDQDMVDYLEAALALQAQRRHAEGSSRSHRVKMSEHVLSDSDVAKILDMIESDHYSSSAVARRFESKLNGPAKPPIALMH